MSPYSSRYSATMLQDLLRQNISPSMIDYIHERSRSALPKELRPPVALPTPPLSPCGSPIREADSWLEGDLDDSDDDDDVIETDVYYTDGVVDLQTFIRRLIRNSHAPIGTILGALVLLDRAHISIAARTKQIVSSGKAPVRALHDTPHRLFGAALVLAGHALNDLSPNSGPWSGHMSSAGLSVEPRAITVMVDQLLSWVNYNVSISESDLEQHIHSLYRCAGLHRRRRSSASSC